MANKTLVYIHDDIEITDTSIPPMERDILLENDNNGVRFLFDLANAFSYNPDTAPTNGKVVNDMGEISANGTISSPAGLLAAGGGGVDFSSIAAIDNGVRLPASVAADLWADQEYIVCGYFKLPTSGNWPPQTSGLGGTLMTACTGTEDYSDSPEIGLICCNLGAVGRISFRRQGVIPTNATDIALSGMHTIHGGLLAQIAYWRTATECNFRIKSAGGTSLGAAAAAGAKNTSDFSAKQMNFGPFGQYGLANSGNFKTGLRLYRGFVINHKRMGYTGATPRAGFDPVSILNGDYDRTIARAAFG